MPAFVWQVARCYLFYIWLAHINLFENSYSVFQYILCRAKSTTKVASYNGQEARTGLNVVVDSRTFTDYRCRARILRPLFRRPSIVTWSTSISWDCACDWLARPYRFTTSWPTRPWLISASPWWSTPRWITPGMIYQDPKPPYWFKFKGRQKISGLKRRIPV